MRTNIITCDRCKCSATTEDEKKSQDIKSVAVAVYTESHSSYSHVSFRAQDSAHVVEWCKECRDAMGLYYHHPDKPPVAPYPTIEDLIREIATDAAKDAVRQ